MNLAKYVHESCITAVEECPTFARFEDDQLELVRGNYISVEGLPDQGIEAVIGYWRDKETIGGHLLWTMGYSVELPEDVQELFTDIDKVMAQALRDYFLKGMK